MKESLACILFSGNGNAQLEPLENLARNGKLRADVGDTSLVSTGIRTDIVDIDHCPRGSQLYNQHCCKSTHLAALLQLNV